MKNKIILGLVVLIILAVIFRKDLGRIFGDNERKDLTEDQVEDNVDDTVIQLSNITLIDGSVYNESYYVENQTFFEGIANAQYNQLNSTNPDENALFNQVMNLTGAELLGVYKAYGSKVWVPALFGSSINANLLEWYSFQLNDGFIPFDSAVYYDDTVFGCEGYFDQCYEATFMGAIWYKSGLNTNIWTDSSQYSADQDAGYSILEDQEG
jgi:hypothetical protein